ncbi:MAG: DUF3352 domain-containing protein [Solirubrobacterales bacterium]
MILRARLSAVLPIAAVAAALTVAGCGGGGGGAGSADPASLAPASSPLFIEATIRPKGELKSNIESLTKTLAGISDPGSLIVNQLDSAMRENDPSLSYQDDIEPWLGEKGGLFMQHYDGQSFSGVAAILQTTDSAEAQDFIDKISQTSDSPVKQGSYEGVDYSTSTNDGTTVGVVDDLFVAAEDLGAFKSAVDASSGSSLSENKQYKVALAGAPGGSLADVYVNVGDLIKSAGAQVDQQVLQFYDSIGIDFSNSTALASIVPGADQVEIDATTSAAGGMGTGNVTDFLGSFPAGSFIAYAAPDVGSQFKKVIDGFDKNGIPGEVAPGQLKSTLGAAGINLDRIASEIGNVGVFVEGGGGAGLSGALVVQSDSAKSASGIVSDVESFVRRAGATGFKQVPGGFSLTDRANFGSQPVVVVSRGDRVAIGYGDKAAQQAVSGSGATLSGNATFKDAAKSLGGTSIIGFLDIGSVLKLAESTGGLSGADYRQAKPYLDKLDFAAIGGGTSGDTTTSKVIVKLKG